MIPKSTTDPLHQPDFRPPSAAGLPAPELPTGSSGAELTALMGSLLQVCSELQLRVSELELTDRLRARRSPSHSLGIDY